MPKKPQRERRVGGLELQVLASGTWDAPASLFLTSLQSGDSYLFNCGEGLQRFCQEHGLKMAGRLRRVLLTRLTWEAIGGLPGALLTMHSTDHGGALRVHGPTGVAALVSSFRHFVVRSALPAAVTEHASDLSAPPLLLDEIGVRATPLLLHPDDADADADGDAAAPVPKRPRTDASFASAITAVPALCWLLEIPPAAPKFDAAAAEALGVPPGPLRGELCAGRPVTLADGSEVRPEQVLLAAGAAELVLIVDCPSAAHVRPLAAHPALAAHVGAATAQPLALVVHLTAAEVAATAEYVRFCAALPAATRQLLLNHAPQPQRLAFVASARLHLKLHAVHEGLFAWPPCQLPAMPTPPEMPASVVLADMLTKWVIRPADRAGVCRDDEAKLHRWCNSKGVAQSLVEADVREELERLPALLHELRALPPSLQLPPGTWQHSLRAAAPPLDHANAAAAVGAFAAAAAAPISETSEAGACAVAAASSARLLFLGTGASVPSKYRNVSSILLQCDGGGGGGDGGGGDAPLVGALLDVGEGTCASLRRHFGRRYAAAVRALQLVWISHIHADHHLGLVQLLEERSALAPGAPLVVIGPHALRLWLRDAAAALHAPLESRFVHSAAAAADPAVGGALRRLGAEWLRVAPVEHCSDAWAVGLQHTEGWGLVYSGDTRPCDAVVELGRALRPACRLLVHEATFDDSEAMAREAQMKRHSTIGEALGVGAAMGAWRVLLTHFSQRYPKLADPRIGGAPTAGAIVAFDQMVAPFALLRDLPRLMPALLCLFADELTDEDGLADVLG